MILNLSNLEKKQQIQLDKIFHNCKEVENLIYKIFEKEKNEIIFSNLISRQKKIIFIINYLFKIN